MAELRFNVDQKFQKTLSDLAENNNGAENQADIIKRAVATYKYFRDIPEGFKIQVVDDKGDVLMPDVTVP